MIKRTIAIVLAFCCMVLMTGCWDAIELNRRAIVSGIGIDQAPEDERKLLVTFQVIIADEITGKTGRGATPTSTYSGTGYTISEAIRNASRQVPRLTSTAHARFIAISESVARKGITEVMDFLDRDSDIRLTSDVVIVKQEISAEAVTASLTPIGKITAYSLSQKAEFASKEHGENYTMEIDDIIRDLLTPGGGAVINGVGVVGDVNETGKKSSLEKTKSPLVVLEDPAIFKGDKLVDWLAPNESRGMVWIKNKMKKTSIVLEPDQEKGDIGIDVIRSKTGLQAKLNDPLHPVIQVSVNVQLSIREVNTAIDLKNPDMLHKIEAKANEAIAKDLRAAVQKAQSVNSDIFGFGEVVQRQSPAAWKKIQHQWGDLFPQLEVEYKVNSVIRNTQLRDRSYKFNQRS
ncbi:Ger(x)C family spore germination protein [Paenibacillus fonticola]|uniref:Ger(x)C family spore germination protein n=1 Tax=Paenibacillus fonticola TaxID=379896 RepID=UPI000371F76B|nr:Ger(x)C family spore germination protein [Paenibacillus fonticola]